MLTLEGLAGYEWLSDLPPADKQRLLQIRTAAEPILGSNILPHFTDHSVSHSDRVVAILGRLLLENLRRKDDLTLNRQEMFVLVAAAIWHDVGMQLPKAHGIDTVVTEFLPETFAQIRKNHGEVSGIILRDLVDGKDPLNLGLNTEDLRKFLPLIAVLCERHQSSADYKPDETVQIGGSKIRLGLLIALLRIADQLDCDFRRVRMDFLQHFSVPLESIQHWIMCHYIDSVSIDDGFVEIFASYPETLSGPIVEFLSTKVLEKCKKEHSPAEKALWSNNVKLHLPDHIIQTGTDYTFAKLPLPESVVSSLKGQLSGLEPSHAQPSAANVGRVANDSERADFMSYWGFVGNPFLDRPVAYGSELFVETRQITEITGEAGQHLKGPTGDLRLIIGGRGSGKTTLFQTLDRKFGSEFSIYIIDVADRIPGVRSANDLHQLILSSIRTTLKPDEQNTSPERLVELAKLGRKKAICLDSVDRLPEDRLDVMRDFFKTAQRFLTELRGVSVVFLACGESWGNALASKELSYLGLRNQWTLQPFSTPQIVEMLEKRLRSSGKSFEEIFDSSCAAALQTLSSGNPRSVLEHTEAICRLAAQQGEKRITRQFIRDCYEKDFDDALQGLFRELTRSDSTKKGLTALYLFYLEMERRNLDITGGWRYLLEMLRTGLPREKVSPPFYVPLSLIGFVTEPLVQDKAPIYKTHAFVAEVFSTLKKKGYAPEDFVSFYSASPIRPVEEDDEVLVRMKSPLLTGDDLEHFEKARQAYFDLKRGTRPAFQVITMAWDCVEQMLTAILIRQTQYRVEKLDALKETAYFTDKYGVRKLGRGAGRVFGEAANVLVQDFMSHLKATKHYLSSYNSLKWIRDTRNEIIRGRAQYLLRYGEKERDLCLRHIDPVFKELVLIYG